MKIGVSSYSFSKMVTAGRIDYLEIPSRAREYGFDIIEIWDGTLPDSEPRLESAERLREASAKAGIEMGNYTMKADFINGVGVPPEREVERVHDELKVASALGSPGMRHDATWKFDGTFDQALPLLADGCRKVAGLGEALGIRTMVENHGYFAQDSERMEKLVAEVNHENFGLLIDMGNFIVVDEDPAKAVGKLAPYALHVHAKDMHVKPGTHPDPGTGWSRSRAGNYWRGAIIGHGVVPVAQCLSVLRKAGYDGAVAIEFEGIEDPEIGITYGLENLKRYLG